MRVLVAVSSKHGGTAEMAGWIGSTLVEAGIDAVTLPVDAVADVEEFDAVVLGSGVYAGHWLDAGRRFAKAHTPRLVNRPVWLFSSGPVGDPPKPLGDPVGIPELIDATGAREHRLFGGRIEREHMGFGERAVVTALRVSDRDDRPRDEVVAWARSIAAELTTISRPTVAASAVR